MSSGLFGIEHSNRSESEHWGKNCFNSSFPTAMASYMLSNKIPAVYIKLEKINGELCVVADEIPLEQAFNSGLLTPEELYFSFESIYKPYQKYSFDVIDGIDLVVQDLNGKFLAPLEVKLTVLPTDSTSRKTEDKWGCELVIRSATTSYCALGMFDSVADEARHVREIFEDACSSIQMWDNDFEMTHKMPALCDAINQFQKEYYTKQKPLLMQTLWKTQGKSPLLANQAFDIVIWSDYAFSRLFIDGSESIEKTMKRPQRATARLARCLWELSKSGKIRVVDIYRQMAFGNQTDKEFAINGDKWRRYVSSQRVVRPILAKEVVNEIIEPGNIQRLSPERRFDQTLYFTAQNKEANVEECKNVLEGKKIYEYKPKNSALMVAETKVAYGEIDKVIPCGAFVRHRVFGIGQVNSISLSFADKSLCEYPYLVGKRDEFSIKEDGKTVIHERFGVGEVFSYRIAFKDSELHFTPDDFNNKEIELVIQ